MSLTKQQIEELLTDDTKLRHTCIVLVETMKQLSMKQLDLRTFQNLNQYSPDEYVEFARKNLKDKLSKM